MISIIDAGELHYVLRPTVYRPSAKLDERSAVRPPLSADVSASREPVEARYPSAQPPVLVSS